MYSLFTYLSFYIFIYKEKDSESVKRNYIKFELLKIVFFVGCVFKIIKSNDTVTEIVVFS